MVPDSRTPSIHCSVAPFEVVLFRIIRSLKLFFHIGEDLLVISGEVIIKTVEAQDLFWGSRFRV